MSGFERRGRWNVPRKLTTFTLWGGGVVDLRYADFTSPDVEIHSYSIMGGQTILVPPEVNVDLRGIGVMGALRPVDKAQALPGAPRVTVRGFSLGARSPSSGRSAGPASVSPAPFANYLLQSWVPNTGAPLLGSPFKLHSRMGSTFPNWSAGGVSSTPLNAPLVPLPS